MYIRRDNKLEATRVKYTGMKVIGLKVAWINKGRIVWKYTSTILDKTLLLSRETSWNQGVEISMASTSSTKEKWKDLRKKIFSYKKHQILPRMFHIHFMHLSEVRAPEGGMRLWYVAQQPTPPEVITNMWKQIDSYMFLKNESSKIVLKPKFKIVI